MFIAFLGWLAFVVGTLMVLGALSLGGLGGLLIVPAIGVVLAGLLLVVQGQTLQALVDVASDTTILVSLVRQRLGRVEG